MTAALQQEIGEAGALAERIAHYPRVRLCECLDGSPHYADELLSEQDRFLIVRALWAFRDRGR